MSTKPTNLPPIWANAAGAADLERPDDAKINTGWAAEIPTHQNFNWLQNYFAAYLAHINCEGLPAWDAETEYPATAWVKGTDGEGYKRSGTGTNTGTDPVGDNTGAWESLFAPAATASIGNRIINGAFAINQRVVSGTVTLLAGAYGHDRWKAGAGGCTYTFNTVSGLTTITITSGTLQQEIEGVNIDSGDYVLGWTGTAQGRIGLGSYGASGAVTATLVGGQNATVEFNTGTLTRAQLETGATPTSFAFRPRYQELALCRRYYEKSYIEAEAPGATTDSGVVSLGTRFGGTTTGGGFAFLEEKPSDPAVTFYNRAGSVNGASFRQNGNWFDTDTIAFVSATPGGVLYDLDGSGNGVSFGHYTAEAEL